MKDKFTSLVPEDATIAAGYLAMAFSWSESMEGDEYWRTVHAKLIAIAASEDEPREEELDHD